MKKKLIFAFFAAFFAFLSFSGSPGLVFGEAGAAMAKQDIPPVDGTYDVPGKPNMKVRVFVHHPKTRKVPDQGSACIPNADENSDTEVSGAGWHLSQGNWKYYVNSASAPRAVGSLNFKNLTDFSFASWQNNGLEAAGVNFVNLGSTTLSRKALDGSNIVAFGSVPSTALGVTYTWFYTASGEAVETDTIMNKKIPWSWTPYNFGICVNSLTYDVQNILTHELGHWVGLNDHYTAPYENNTMYGYGSKGEIKKDTLTNGDMNGANRIY